MSIAILFNQKDSSVWLDQLKEKLPHETIEVYPEIKNKDDVEFLVTWKPHVDYSKEFTNLKVVQSVGAGIDHLLHTKLSDDIIVSRIVDPDLMQDMFEHVLTCVMGSMKNTLVYFKDQMQRRWEPKSYKAINNTTITILGLGEIGLYVAQRLKTIGFNVNGWSSSLKSINGISTFSGENELLESVKKSDFIVNLLPLTAQTQNILNYSLFQILNQTSVIINVGRGGHLVEDDLILALEQDLLKEAYLDVFNEEPLPEDHKFWSNPNIYITPHIASITNPFTAIDLVIDNYLRFQSEKELLHVVDLERGY